MLFGLDQASEDEVSASVEQRLDFVSLFSAAFVFPCVPSATNLILKRLQTAVAGFGRQLPDHTWQTVREQIHSVSQEGQRRSQYNRLAVNFSQVPDHNEQITISVKLRSREPYQDWFNHRRGPLFGPLPDAKALTLAFAGPPQGLKVLDVGAALGRNTIPLALFGCAVDALEMVPTFCEKLRAGIAEITDPRFPRPGDPRAINVIEGDFFDRQFTLPRAPYDLVLLAEVICSHGTSDEVLRSFLTRIAECMADNGIALVSAFVCEPGHVPSVFARELGWSALTCIFTAEEIAQAVASAGLEVVSSENAIDFERAQCPPEAWPPTSWYEGWATGRNVYHLKSNYASPVALRWLTLRRRSGR